MNSTKKTKMGTLIAAAVALIAMLVLPFMGINNYIITLFCQAMLYSIIVYGLNFITGLTGQMNMGNAAVYGIGAYIYALLTTRAEMAPWFAMIFVALAGWFVGVILGYPSLRVKGVYLSLTTIAFNEIVRLVIQNMRFTNGVNGIRNIPSLGIFGFTFNTPMRTYYFFLAALVIFTLISIRFLKSKYGRVLVAIRDNIDAVESCGINLADIKVKAFVLSTVFGAIAGGMYASFMRYVAPNTFSTNLSISFVVMLILGGRGSVVGCLLGAFIITFAPEALRFLGDYYQFVYAVIVILAIIFNPNGLVSLGGRILAKIKRISVPAKRGANG